MKEWLLTFAEHYRQPISERSALAYFEGLRDIGPEDMEAACKHAFETSEFMPVVAKIREALEEVRRASVGQEQYLGVPLLDYPKISQTERDAAIAESEAFIAKLKAQIGIGQVIKAPTTGHKIPIVPPTRSLEEQKAELVRRGFLTGTPHHPGCLCPDCRERREK